MQTPMKVVFAIGLALCASGHQGLPIEEYKKLWHYADFINFGF